ncbi:IS110 family transposase, partial [Streptomyces sp. NPDC006459]
MPGQGRTKVWWRGLHVIDTSTIDVFLGLDVGKGGHHATAVTPAGKKAFDKRLP